MAQIPQNTRRLQVGSCYVDLSLNEIVDGDRCTRIAPKAAAVLEVLIHFAGRPVSKEHLLIEAWRGEYPGDDVVTNAIAQLRRAFGDDARSPRYVRTVPRVGYVLLADVRPLAEAPPLERERAPEENRMPDTAPPSHEAAVDSGARALSLPAKRIWIPFVLLLVVLSIAIGILIGGARGRSAFERGSDVVPMTVRQVTPAVTYRHPSYANGGVVGFPLDFRQDATEFRWQFLRPSMQSQESLHESDIGNRATGASGPPVFADRSTAAAPGAIGAGPAAARTHDPGGA